MIGHIFIYGGIGSGAGEVSIQSVKSQMSDAADEYVVHIISPGGEVFEGYGIYNALKNTGKKITTHIEGLCASIATLIAFAGDTIVMNKTGEFMIHNPKISDIGGDSAELRNVANQLDKIKTILIDVASARAQRNGKPISNDKLWALYDNETWLTADEAVQIGFVDESVDAIKAVAKVDMLNIKEMKTEPTEIQKFMRNIANLFKAARISNQVSDTLADGRVVMIMAEGADWTGAQIVLEDGSPLDAGDYTLQSGKMISVDANSTITAVQDAPPANKAVETPAAEPAVEALQNEVQALKVTNETLNNELTDAKVENSKFENRLKNLEKQYLQAMEKLTETYGDTTPVSHGDGKIVNKNQTKQKAADPMGDDIAAFYKSRNLQDQSN